MVTCKEFLSELNEVLDQTAGQGIRKELEEHLRDCPNCWVVCDTTKKTLDIYRGSEPMPIPEDVHTRLMEALRKREPRIEL